MKNLRFYAFRIVYDFHTETVGLTAGLVNPPAVFPDREAAKWIEDAGFTSPFAAAFAVPLDIGASASSTGSSGADAIGNWPLFFAYVAFCLGLNGGLLLTMIWLFNTRWRVAG